MNSSARFRIAIAAFSVQCLIRCFTSSKLYVGRGGDPTDDVGSEAAVEELGWGESEVGSFGLAARTSESVGGGGDVSSELEGSGTVEGGVGVAAGFERDANASSASCSRAAELIFELDVEYAGEGAPKITGPSLSASLADEAGPADSSLFCSSGYRGTCPRIDDPEKCRARNTRGRARDSEVAALNIDNVSRRRR